MTATLAPFLDPLAFAIVGGGTLAAMVLRTPTRDLAGGFAERTFKLPNPFYLTE